PGVVLYLNQEMKMTPDVVIHMLYYESGLKGVSGISNDMRQLLNSENPRAKEAIALDVHAIVRHSGMMLAELGGVDAFVYTGGIGENAAEIRRMVCEKLACFGVMLDAAANDRHQPHISTDASKVAVLAIPTNEE